MKVNNKVLSVPPYISTAWTFVEGLYIKGATLVVTLASGESVNIPGLSAEFINTIFAAHAEFLEQEAIPRPQSRPPRGSQEMPFGIPGLPLGFPMIPPVEGAFHFGISSIDGFGTAMEHNPAQADAPDLPAEILEKIGAIAKIVSSEDTIAAAPAVQNCNCPHCQITRVIAGESPNSDLFSFADEPLPERVMQASSEPWKIEQTGENQFIVVKQEDQSEYQVFLGNPVSCSCGKQGCEHILAVLKS